MATDRLPGTQGNKYRFLLHGLDCGRNDKPRNRRRSLDEDVVSRNVVRRFAQNGFRMGIVAVSRDNGRKPN